MDSKRTFKNIALIGFMGTGKTSVGHQLATLLHFHFVDTDELIEEKTDRKISEIFNCEGETAFRRYEKAILAELAGRQRIVISTGGGLSANQENIDSLKSHALTVCLWASPEVIWDRVHHQTHRPLLHDPNPQEKIRTLLAEREPFYRQADVLISTELRSVKEVAHQVLYQFKLARKR